VARPPHAAVRGLGLWGCAVLWCLIVQYGVVSFGVGQAAVLLHEILLEASWHPNALTGTAKWALRMSWYGAGAKVAVLGQAHDAAQQVLPSTV
jgi:hypothetical protein